MSICTLTFKCFHPEVMHAIFSHIHRTEQFTWVHVALEVERSRILSLPELEGTV